MTQDEQYNFVRELIANVEAEILRNSARFPEAWDGHELRQYVADRFTDSAKLSLTMNEARSRRMRDYKNTVLVENL